ncbi:MAG: hypothetical protein CM1200mP10_22890 [Candidatus Neomarinimicrobiota bacterium]|nr:MAG: hypothetical protein CM1200mP10_22890 [Candidatus Neomarinimicrobiota bacterium]
MTNIFALQEKEKKDNSGDRKIAKPLTLNLQNCYRIL